MKFTFLLFILLTSNTCLAGFITIDDFTDSTQSDGLGVREFIGDVKVNDDKASMVSGVVWMGEVSSIIYDFLPSPLVVKPKFVLTAKNNQTTFLETGIIRVSINNNPSIERELFAAKQDYETLVFDFSPEVTLVSELRIDYFRPPDTTGARELLIDSIVVSDVPEPPTFLLLSASLITFGAYFYGKQTRRPNGNRRLRRLPIIPRRSFNRFRLPWHLH